MIIAMDKLCRVFSRALDIIEKEQAGASDYHSMRIAALCAAMGKRLGYGEDAICAIATCALFHDNALTEYNCSDIALKDNAEHMIKHCEKGQSSVSWLPFLQNIDGYILYHHERADGSGPFRKRAGEYPFEAALIAAADTVDVTRRLQSISPGELPALREDIKKRAVEFSPDAAAVLADILDADMLESLRDNNIKQTLGRFMPRWDVDVTENTVTSVAGFFSHIIDYKSVFTRKHTSQIANRTWLMSGHYGFDNEQRAALFLAASLHDIGKIATPAAVLEKPGKLDKDEFQIIKDHVRYTCEWLSDVPDFEKIRDWAADHHEKLDGTGYTFGKKSEELDFNSRLIACIDIYQAVCEARPYHGARSHADTMPILRGMADRGLIDSGIVKDLDGVMAEYSLRDVPPPA